MTLSHLPIDREAAAHMWPLTTDAERRVMTARGLRYRAALRLTEYAEALAAGEPDRAATALQHAIRFAIDAIRMEMTDG